MTNTIDGNDLSEGMTPTDFAKSIAFIWILSEISSVFRFVLPLNNPRQAAEILNKPQAVAWKTLNTSSIFRKLGVAATEVTTEVTALLGTSRAVSVLFGENHEELSSNEIAHTIAIVLGMKGFHGLVTIKDARRGLIVYEGKPYDLKTDLTKDSPKNESKETSNNKEKSNKKNTTENFEFEEIKTKTPEEKSKKVQDEINIILETKLQNHNENELQSMINKEKDPTTSPTARAKLKKQLDQLDQIALKEFKDKKAEKNWLNKQFSTHQEYIREASEIISKSSNILPLSLIGLKDLTTISKEEIKNIQREIGLKGEQIDGILGPKTLESLKNYVNEIKTNKNQTYEQTNSQKSEKDNTKKETKTDPESIFRESEKWRRKKKQLIF
jgi:hypothetical protein